MIAGSFTQDLVSWELFIGQLKDCLSAKTMQLLFAAWTQDPAWNMAEFLYSIGWPREHMVVSAPADKKQGFIRYVLYNYDEDETVTTRVYDDYKEAAEDADQLNNVIVLGVPLERKEPNEEIEEKSDEESADWPPRLDGPYEGLDADDSAIPEGLPSEKTVAGTEQGAPPDGWVFINEETDEELGFAPLDEYDSVAEATYEFSQAQGTDAFCVYMRIGGHMNRPEDGSA